MYMQSICIHRLSTQTVYTDCLHRLCTQTVYTEYPHRLSTQSIHTDCLHRLSTQSIHTDCLHRLSTQSIHTDCLHRLSTQSIHTDCLHRLSTQTVYTEYPHRLSTQYGIISNINAQNSLQWVPNSLQLTAHASQPTNYSRTAHNQSINRSNFHVTHNSQCQAWADTAELLIALSKQNVFVLDRCTDCVYNVHTYAQDKLISSNIRKYSNSIYTNQITNPGGRGVTIWVRSLTYTENIEF